MFSSSKNYRPRGKKDLRPNCCHFKFNTGDYCVLSGLNCVCACVCMRASVCMCVCACVRVWSLAFRVKFFLPAMSIFFNLKKILLAFTKSQACLSRITENCTKGYSPKVYGGHTEAEAQSLFISCC